MISKEGISDFEICGDESKKYIQVGKSDPNNPDSIFWVFSERQIRNHFGKLTQLKEYYAIREEMCVTVIKNLIRKVNFLELYQQLLREDITQEEFELEMKQQPNNYTIDINQKLTEPEYHIVMDIMYRIGLDLKEFSNNDVIELFSAHFNIESKTQKKLNR